jgi:beta-alanine--pyruvate transaminase
VSNRLNVTPNDLSAFWMPFTANRQFKKAPRMFVGAKDMHYTTADGRRCSTARRACGASMPATAGRRSPRRSSSRPPSSTTRRPSRWATPRPSSSPTAGRHRARGPQPRPLHQLRLRIGRDRAQGRARLSAREGRGQPLPPDRPRARLSRRQFRRHLGRRHRHQPQDVRHAADRRRPPAAHPRSAAKNAFTRGEPEHGADLADELERIVRCTTPRPSPR